jgi:hypothetical protein
MDVGLFRFERYFYRGLSRKRAEGKAPSLGGGDELLPRIVASSRLTEDIQSAPSCHHRLSGLTLAPAFTV